MPLPKKGEIFGFLEKAKRPSLGTARQSLPSKWRQYWAHFESTKRLGDFVRLRDFALKTGSRNGSKLRSSAILPLSFSPPAKWQSFVRKRIRFLIQKSTSGVHLLPTRNLTALVLEEQKKQKENKENKGKNEPSWRFKSLGSARVGLKCTKLDFKLYQWTLKPTELRAKWQSFVKVNYIIYINDKHLDSSSLRILLLALVVGTAIPIAPVALPLLGVAKTKNQRHRSDLLVSQVAKLPLSHELQVSEIAWCSLPNERKESFFESVLWVLKTMYIKCLKCVFAFISAAGIFSRHSESICIRKLEDHGAMEPSKGESNESKASAASAASAPAGPPQTQPFKRLFRLPLSGEPLGPQKKQVKKCR